MADMFYTLIDLNRIKWFGRQELRYLPTPEEKTGSYSGIRLRLRVTEI